MIKTGKVVIGQTPSIVSGSVSDRIVDGEPLAEGETACDPQMTKAAALLKELDVEPKQS